VLTTNDKGHVAELEIAAAATRLGIPVLRPLTDHGRCDLAFDAGARLWRVQCKWGHLSPDGDVVIARTGTNHWSSGRFVCGTYTEAEVDLFAIYCQDLDRCYLLPVSLVAGKHQIRLRLTPARNGQQACTNLASDFEFHGAIAQLGERLHGMQEVVGSSPTSSTSVPEPVAVGSNPFRDQLGYWMDLVAAGQEIVITRHGKPRVRLSPAT
jgi:hypothetical protein